MIKSSFQSPDINSKFIGNAQNRPTVKEHLLSMLKQEWRKIEKKNTLYNL